MRTVIIIQARMGSTRLPGKILLGLAGEPMLARVVSRARRSALASAVVAATTTESADRAVVELCAARGWPCFAGSRDDVLDRFYHAARLHAADVVVRLTADCPFIDPGVIDQVIRAFREGESVDYASNVLPPRTFPRGLDTEVFSFAALERAWHEDDNPAWREHVTPFLYRHPERFRLRRVAAGADYSNLRWTVDTPEDRELAVRVYDAFGHDRFSWQDVLALLGRYPEWLELNRHVEQKAV
jgi:spore coat polysaccharide biosynthesis protein SpsF